MIITEFIFDDWVKLYESNPIEFEYKRAEILKQVICDAPIEIRDKLRIIQMECDVIHNLYSGIEATTEISKIMINKLNELIIPLEELKTICDNYHEE